MLNKPQLLRFACIGSLAALTHLSIIFCLVEFAKLPPLLANLFAFLCAFFVSYFGHLKFTFADSTTTHQHAMPRFFIIATMSFILNQGLFYLFLIGLHMYYMAAIVLVLLIVPPITFVLSKCWAFR